MLKSITVAVAAAAFMLSPGVAHADAVTDAINSHHGQPGMVQYLNSARTLFDAAGDPDYIWNVDNVDDLVFVGGFYCDPATPPFPFVNIPLAQRKSITIQNLQEDAPLVANGLVPILNQLCTNY